MTPEALAADPGIVRDWQRACRAEGVLVRPLARGIAVSPPLVCGQEEIALLADGIGDGARPARRRYARGLRTDMDVCEVSAGGLRSALGRGEVSAVEVLEAVLERADRVSGPLNPFAVRLDERARRAASAADAALAAGPPGRCAACRSRSRTRTIWPG